MSDFRIGSNASADPATWSVLSTLLAGEDKNYEPEWTFRAQSMYGDQANGGRIARGNAVASWRWGALRFGQRQLLKAFCSGLSTQVYIRTATNETTAGAQIFDDFLCWMNWTPQNELVGVNYVEQVEIIFTNLVAI